MLGRQVLSVMLDGQQRIFAGEVAQQQVRSVVLLRMHHHRHRLGPDTHSAEDLRDRDPLPVIVELAPAGDAVNVRCHLDPRQLQELLPGP
jgi:hypothetical protein